MNAFEDLPADPLFEVARHLPNADLYMLIKTNKNIKQTLDWYWKNRTNPFYEDHKVSIICETDRDYSGFTVWITIKNNFEDLLVSHISTFEGGIIERFTDIHYTVPASYTERIEDFMEELANKERNKTNPPHRIWVQVIP